MLPFYVKIMIPGTMEVQGLTNQAEYERIRALTKIASPDAAKKIAGFLNKVIFIIGLRLRPHRGNKTGINPILFNFTIRKNCF